MPTRNQDRSSPAKSDKKNESLPAKRKRKRPGDDAAKRKADQHRRDLNRLHRAIEATLALDDAGAGPRGSQASAIGVLTRATETVHKLERDLYGLAAGGDGAGKVQPVILLPVPADDMAAWGAAARTVLGLPDQVSHAEEVRGAGYRVVEAEEVEPDGQGGDQ